MSVVTVLRDKGSEWTALMRASAQAPLPFIPLLEAVCEPYIVNHFNPQPKNPLDVLSKLGLRLGGLSTSQRAWVDLDHLLSQFTPEDVGRFLTLVGKACGSRVSEVVPVIRTTSPGSIRDVAMSWARKSGSGICIRVLGVTQLKEKADAVSSIVAECGLAPTAIDFCIDAQDLPRFVSHDTLIGLFPLAEDARTWSVVGRGFNRTIGELDPKIYVHELERTEWVAWIEQSLATATRRVPLYGDYGAQNPVYVPSAAFPGSASLRYSDELRFVVLRGRGQTAAGGTDCSQFIGHARYLVRQPFFRSILSTPGDDYAAWIATGKNRSGNAWTWRIATFARHFGVVEAQLAAVWGH